MASECETAASRPPKKARVSGSRWEDQFHAYARALDVRHREQEAVYKAARAVIQESKRAIFQILRTYADRTHYDPALFARESSSATTLLDAVEEDSSVFVAALRDAVGELFALLPTCERYERDYHKLNWAMQELVEAIGLHMYVRYGRLPDYEEWADYAHRVAGFTLPYSLRVDDFLLGLLDVGGEVVRFHTGQQEQQLQQQQKQQLQHSATTNPHQDSQTSVALHSPQHPRLHTAPGRHSALRGAAILRAMLLRVPGRRDLYTQKRTQLDASIAKLEDRAYRSCIRHADAIV